MSAFGRIQPNPDQWAAICGRIGAAPPVAGGTHPPKSPQLWKYRDPRYRGQLIGCCFPAGTMVRMADGTEKPIEAVQVGDCVVSHAHGSQRVTQTFQRDFTGDLVTVRAAGNHREVTATEDHQFAVESGDLVAWPAIGECETGDRLVPATVAPSGSVQALDVLKLIEGGFSVHDAVADKSTLPHANQKAARLGILRCGIAAGPDRVLVRGSAHHNAILRHIDVTPALGRLIGLFLAEGSSDRARVRFYFHRKEAATLAAETAQLVRGVLGIEATVILPKSRPTLSVVQVAGEPAARFFKALCPGNVWTKRVPGVLMSAPQEVRLAVLSGWLDGDGHARIRHRAGSPFLRLMGVTASSDLAADMLLLARASGVNASVRERPARGRSKTAYEVSLSGKRALALVPQSAAGIDTDCLYTRETSQKIRSQPIAKLVREHVENRPVYDFEVEHDHSFIANGYVVHNCVGESTAAMGETTIRTPEPLKDDSVPNPAVDLSPLWCYWAARKYSADHGTPLYGEGAIVSDAMAAMVEVGFRAYTDWPATPANYQNYSDRSPMATAVNGKPIKVRGEARRLTDPDQILEYLGQGYSVVCGLAWRGGSRTASDGKFSWGGWSLGGHAIELLGYDEPGDKIVIGNSWQNAGWGVNPGCWGYTSLRAFLRDCSASALANGVVEAIVITEIGDAPLPPKPDPTPDPTPQPPGDSYPVELVIDGRRFKGTVQEVLA